MEYRLKITGYLDSDDIVVIVFSCNVSDFKEDTIIIA